MAESPLTAGKQQDDSRRKNVTVAPTGATTPEKFWNSFNEIRKLITFSDWLIN